MESAPQSPSRVERLLFLLAAVAVLVSTILGARLALATRTGTVDSAYYFARAASLEDGASLRNTTINWGEGVDRKFFPGYPLALQATALHSFPERAWRTLAVCLVPANLILLGFAFRRLGLGFGASCLGVVLFSTFFVPLNWTTMPMAEGTALFWLALAVCLLPAREDATPVAFLRFLVSCGLGGMAILTRAEAAYPVAAMGLVGAARLRGRPGWLAVTALGVAAGVAPFAYWVSSLPPGAGAENRLHYVNEFFREFSFRDRENVVGKGGFLDNFGRAWWHPVFNWGRIPFAATRGEEDAFKAFWILLWAGWIGAAIAGLAGSAGRRLGVAFVGFLAFRSLWYYPYDRFLITGLPIGVAAMALAMEGLARRGRGFAVLTSALVALWLARGWESILTNHKLFRHMENGSHSYRDEAEQSRLRDQFNLTLMPLEEADITRLAARRFTRVMPGKTSDVSGREDLRRREAIALEFPWPQLCYALRGRPIVLGWPLENFWGDAEYRGGREVVPLDAESRPVRTPRRAIDFLRDRGVRYVITARPRYDSEGGDIYDRGYGSWCDWVALEAGGSTQALLRDFIVERPERTAKYEWPRYVRILELVDAPSDGAASQSKPR